MQFPPHLQKICNKSPVIYDLVCEMAEAKPVHWLNPNIFSACKGVALSGFSRADVIAAAERLVRFAPYIAQVFPETGHSGGIIESPLRAAAGMRAELEQYWNVEIKAPLVLKLDSHLPVSGSIKARGGFYEVLAHAEALALRAGILKPGVSYARLADPEVKEFFSRYALGVGSTGNLGLSVGLMGAALGFKTTVHMSADARQWKKELLRERGVTVVEYASDYSAAVEAGREEAKSDPNCYFVDDEDSPDLFLGYSVAALRLETQLAEAGINFSPEQPLCVYLPCGVGGGPGGVAFGLKLMFGDAVRCYFGEPVQAPAVSLGLITGLDDKVSGTDLGLSGKTAADGLAVSRPSGLVCRAMRHLLDGVYTVPDQNLFSQLHLLGRSDNIRLELSALAGFDGVRHTVLGNFDKKGAAATLTPGAHLVWATGGSLVPAAEWADYDAEGRRVVEAFYTK